mgnify:CR=1 FL=1
MIFGRIRLWLLGALGLLVTILFAFLKGKTSQAQQEAEDRLGTYIETRKRIDEAASVDRDAAAAREWLRNRSK